MLSSGCSVHYLGYLSSCCSGVHSECAVRISTQYSLCACCLDVAVVCCACCYISKACPLRIIECVPCCTHHYLGYLPSCYCFVWVECAVRIPAYQAPLIQRLNVPVERVADWYVCEVSIAQFTCIGVIGNSQTEGHSDYLGKLSTSGGSRRVEGAIGIAANSPHASQACYVTVEGLAAAQVVELTAEAACRVG